MRQPWVSLYEPLMGTTLEVRVWADDVEQARTADAAALEEVQRLVGVLSGYDPGSETSRWCRGEADEVSSDLAACLTLAQRWHAAGGGAFHPACRALQRRWERAVAEQVLPDAGELMALAQALAALPFRVEWPHGTASVERRGDCRALDLNAVAKGYVVDRALERARAVPGVRSALVNAGGDLRHEGPDAVTVRVEDPHRPYDNVEPLTRIEVSGAAMATSGTAHRGFAIGGRWFGHVIDPRTGWPVHHTASATVLAADAATADAVATVVMVLPPEEGLAFADGLDGVAALVVRADGRVDTSTRWPAMRDRASMRP